MPIYEAEVKTAGPDPSRGRRGQRGQSRAERALGAPTDARRSHLDAHETGCPSVQHCSASRQGRARGTPASQLGEASLRPASVSPGTCPRIPHCPHPGCRPQVMSPRGLGSRVAPFASLLRSRHFSVPGCCRARRWFGGASFWGRPKPANSVVHRLFPDLSSFLTHSSTPWGFS